MKACIHAVAVLVICWIVLCWLAFQGGCHDVYAFVYFGPTKQQTREFGNDLVELLRLHKEKTGLFPTRLADLPELPTRSSIQVDYGVGSRQETYILKVVAGPHKWQYYEMHDGWDYGDFRSD